LPQINYPALAEGEHGAMFMTRRWPMFLFFDFFARTLNYELGRPCDSVEQRREASLGARRVQARRWWQKPVAAPRQR
jgi:hypothetical protein